MYEGKVVDIERLDFSTAFDTVSYIIFLGKLSSCCTSRFMMLGEELAAGQAQRVVKGAADCSPVMLLSAQF